MPLSKIVRSGTAGALRSRNFATLRTPLNGRYSLQHGLSPRDSSLQRPTRNPPFHRRSFFTESLPTLLVPPAVFTSLLLTLWTYKCLMTIIFQHKIIYMSYMPPGARSEKLSTYTPDCKPIEWQQTQIRSLDNTKIALCIGSLPPKTPKPSRHIVICYFQGNGSSPPPRLPLLSNVLKSIAVQNSTSTHFTIVALSYRGYWTSSGRSSQPGIEKDAQALLQWVTATYGRDVQLILWGQSLGAGVASTAAATSIHDTNLPRIAGLILETPFSSIKSMLIALYPQKWLPYRYLHPFLRNHWDSEVALRRIKERGWRGRILLVEATRDEVVPPEEVVKLERVCAELGLDVERREVVGALHNEATVRREGQDAVAGFVVEVVGRGERGEGSGGGD